jgi:hypothetical protein
VTLDNVRLQPANGSHARDRELSVTGLDESRYPYSSLLADTYIDRFERDLGSA